MSLLRSPNGSGLGGSQPNLTKLPTDKTSDFGMSQITIRNKRKQPDDDNDIRNDISELKKQMTEMMTLLTSTTNLHTESIKKLNKLSQDVSTIKDEVRNISNTMDNIILEQNCLKLQIEDLKLTSENTEKRLEAVESDVNLLKNTAHSSVSKPTIYEELLVEVKDRSARAKNVVIVGIPELKSSVPAERREHDQKEISKVIKTINSACPDPEKVYRLGKFKADVNRPIKVCYKSEEIAISLLRSKNKPVGNIKIYSDQTLIQRKHLHELKKELETRIANGEPNLRIKYKNGIPIITDSIERKNENYSSNFLTQKNLQ